MTIAIAKTDSGYRLTSELWLDAPREKVFSFFADAFQLEAITPPWLHFSVQTPAPIPMGNGTTIDYKLRLHGIPVRWRSVISQWHAPFRFVDQQLRGPYRYWHHLHTFKEVDGGTLVGDTVDYSMPLAFLMHSLLIRRDLTKIFTYRHHTMKDAYSNYEDSGLVACRTA